MEVHAVRNPVPHHAYNADMVPRLLLEQWCNQQPSRVMLKHVGVENGAVQCSVQNGRGNGTVGEEEKSSSSTTTASRRRSCFCGG